MSLELSPYNHNIHRWIASGYYNLSNYQKALEYYSNVLSIDNNNPENFKSVGLCYYKLENYDEAIEYLEKAIELYSKNNEKDYKSILLLEYHIIE